MEKKVIEEAERLSADKAKDEFDKKVQEFEESDIDKVLENNEKISKKSKSGALNKFFNEIQLLLRLIQAYRNGEYTQIPLRTIVSVVAALLYVFSPIDLIPDFIPVIGLIDDAAVMAICIALVEEDIKDFEQWEKQQSQKNSN